MDDGSKDRSATKDIHGRVWRVAGKTMRMLIGVLQNRETVSVEDLAKQ
jgi:hypothetical protein